MNQSIHNQNQGNQNQGNQNQGNQNQGNQNQGNQNQGNQNQGNQNQGAQGKSYARSLSSTGRVLRTQMWLWPILAAAVLALVGWQVRRAVERTMEENLASGIQTILNADVAALDIWFAGQKDDATSVASDRQTSDLISRLVGIASAIPATEDAGPLLLKSPEMAELRKEIAPRMARDPSSNTKDDDFTGFIVYDYNYHLIASDRDDLILLANRPDTREQFTHPAIRHVLAKALEGTATVSPPYASKILLTDGKGELRTNLPTMFACAPVRDAQGKIVACVGLRIRPEVDFTRILNIGQTGKSGETYAFDKNGLMLSESRFDDELKRIGLLVPREDSHSILNVELRDPGVDMTQGERPDLNRSEQPLTRMAQIAVTGESGVDVFGYRDYRGAKVIGAWRWLPEYSMGVATEVDVAEAYHSLYILRRMFWGLFALLGFCAALIFLFMIMASRSRQAARRAVMAAKKLGQYTLDEKIGAGGMGVVYKAHHAMLRRPTAVKMLDADKTNDSSVGRFEREVQLTSGLNHPNTIAIYDYGRTPEGVFYYAMEYLDGVDLEQLVAKHGPLPAGRVIHILRQICGSLSEAHGVGLMHRDVKPANVILNLRGGIADYAKLLDFGLVKAMDSSKGARFTAADSLTGTPAYMAPECVASPEDVNSLADIYAVGAVGYFLLTGQTVFDGKSVMEIYGKHVKEAPIPPGQRAGRTIPADLEGVILRCLAKKPSERPHSAVELARQLDACADANSWTADLALTWWTGPAASETIDSPGPSGKTKPPTQSIAQTATLDHAAGDRDAK